MERTADGVKVHSELDKVEKEIAIMKKLVHQNLVCLYEVIDDTEDDQLFMFMEYVELGPVMKCDLETNKFARDSGATHAGSFRAKRPGSSYARSRESWDVGDDDGLWKAVSHNATAHSPAILALPAF